MFAKLRAGFFYNVRFQGNKYPAQTFVEIVKLKTCPKFQQKNQLGLSWRLMTVFGLSDKETWFLGTRVLFLYFCTGFCLLN